MFKRFSGNYRVYKIYMKKQIIRGLLSFVLLTVSCSNEGDDFID